MVESSDIHNLKYMPIINKRINNNQNIASGGISGGQPNQEMDGDQVQLVGAAANGD